MSSRGTTEPGFLVPHDLDRLYTVEEFVTLPEDNANGYEPRGGQIVLAARPMSPHRVATTLLCGQLNGQLPRGLVAVADVDVMLPEHVLRAPEVVVVSGAVARQSRLISADEVRLAVEIRSPGSVHADPEISLFEYADAGIPHYWAVDPRPPVTATVHNLYGTDYQESQRAQHTFAVAEPCPLRIDLDALTG